MIIYQIRLSTGEVRDCSFESEEEMYAVTEFNDEKVVEFWTQEVS